MTIEAVAQKLTEVIKRHDADYIEAHLEESQTSHITYRGREPESIGRATSVGGNVRALVGGGWGFVSFNELDDLHNKVELAIRQARVVGKNTTNFASAAPIVDRVEATVEKDASALPLSNKKQLLDEYNQVIWSIPKIETSVIGYRDGHKRTVFANSEGSYIEQEKKDLSLRIAAIAKFERFKPGIQSALFLVEHTA